MSLANLFITVISIYELQIYFESSKLTSCFFKMTGVKCVGLQAPLVGARLPGRTAVDDELLKVKE